MSDSTTLNEAYNELEEVIKQGRIELNSFSDKGVAAAGARLRGCAQQGKVLLQTIRLGVTEAKNAKKAAKAAPAKGSTKAPAKAAAKATKPAKAAK